MPNRGMTGGRGMSNRRGGAGGGYTAPAAQMDPYAGGDYVSVLNYFYHTQGLFCTECVTVL